MDSLVESKLLLPHEAERLEKVNNFKESNFLVESNLSAADISI